MIFVFLDDNSLRILGSIVDVRRECEGIDVEEGVYQFFDGNGSRLIPKFIKPNKKGKLFGFVSWIESGIFDLIPSSNFNTPDILKMLDTTSVLEPNLYFDNLDEIKAFLAR